MKPLFKRKIVKSFPGTQEQNDSKNVILVFQQGIQQMMKTSMKSSHQENAL